MGLISSSMDTGPNQASGVMDFSLILLQSSCQTGHKGVFSKFHGGLETY